MDGAGGHHVKLNKPDSERQIQHGFLRRRNLDERKKGRKREEGRKRGEGERGEGGNDRNVN
jgi:hypothetical protein